MELEFGPWVECDGSGGPINRPGTVVQVVMAMPKGKKLIEPPDEGCNCATWPGFFWRWKMVRVGWFRSELFRVCDDPAYAPIKRYRIAKPRSTAVDRLAEIVERPPGTWIKDGTDTDPRLPKRVNA